MTAWLRLSFPILLFSMLRAQAACERFLAPHDAVDHSGPASRVIDVRVLAQSLRFSFEHVAKSRMALHGAHLSEADYAAHENWRRRVFRSVKMHLDIYRFLNLSDLDAAMHGLQAMLRGFDELPHDRRHQLRRSATAAREDLMRLERNLREVHRFAEGRRRLAENHHEAYVRGPQLWQAMRLLLEKVARASSHVAVDQAEALFWQQVTLHQLHRLFEELKFEIIRASDFEWRCLVLNAMDLTMGSPTGVEWALGYAHHALSDFDPDAMFRPQRHGLGHPHQLVQALQSLVRQMEQVLIPLLAKPRQLGEISNTQIWPMAVLSRPVGVAVH